MISDCQQPVEIKLLPVNRFLLFGGTPQLLTTARAIRQADAELVVVSEPFHLDEDMGDQLSLQEHLERLQARILSIEKLTPQAIAPEINSSTVGISIYPVWILNTEILALFAGRLFNFHGAQLPRDRGGGGYSWRILSGCRSSGAVIHQLESGIDTGAIVLCDDFSFPDTCRVPADFLAFDSKHRDALLEKFVAILTAGETLSARPQDESVSTYWPRLNTKIHGLVDWCWTAQQLERFICAFDDPYVGASTFLKKNKVHIKGCYARATEQILHPFQAGLVFRIESNRICVAATGGFIELKQVLDEDGKDVINTVHLGDRFHTPQEHLDAARETRAVYTATGVVGRR